jgi:glycogen debranching enzyme
VTFVAGAFDTNGFYTRTAVTAEALAAELTSNEASLRDQLHAFEASLPRTGDSKIDEYLHWYASAAILLTKGDRDGHVLTMGYRELNQRDSFWASGIHLVFWRDLERAMLLETVRGQAPTGRIPSTLLPLIDRGDEIDSTEYFILRAARYYSWYRDEALRKQVWPAMQKALDYLASRDSEHVGVPMQLSFWADWKDVNGETGRRYAPHFALLWLASLRAGSEWALLAKDSVAARRYETFAKRASAFINRPYGQGGLWDGHSYVDRWSDGRSPSYVLQDQVVGAYFNVIAVERLNLLYRQLRANETPWGVREKFPYQSDWTEGMGGMPGNYHNGGIWPYLNFVDATGRYLHGHSVDAERIIHEIGEADLDAQGDNKPSEYLNGDTGTNRGFPIQSWDAELFSTIYFGAFGLERTSASNIDVHVHIPPSRDFSTELVLPACTGTLSRQAGKLSWQEEQDACRKQGIIVNVRGGS